MRPLTIFRSRATVVMAACALAAGGVPLLATPGVAAPAAPLVTPSSPMAQERVEITGAVPGKVRRRVAVQERSDGSWVALATGRTNRKGRYSLTSRVAESTKLRTVAKKMVVGGKRYPKWTSGSRAVRVAPQSVALGLPDTAQAGTPVMATAAALPVRVGRVVDLQRLDGGTWQSVGSDTQDATGATSYSLMPAAGTASYRAVAAAWRGAPAQVSPVEVLTVTDSAGPELVSVALDGGAANNASGAAHVSGNGRYVAFASHASDLVTGDTEGHADVFLRDLQTDSTVRVSETQEGVGGNQDSWNPDVSDDGRYVTYRSSASNLGWNGGNKNDILLWDRVTGATTPVSLPFGPEEISELDGATHGPRISGDGSTVAWVSDDSDLAVDDDDLLRDAYVWDRTTGERTWISHGSETTPGTYAPSNRDVNEIGALSDDGTVVPFVTSATLVSGVSQGPLCCTTEPDVYTWTDFLDEDVVALVTRNDANEVHTDSDQPAVSGNGLRVAFVSGEEEFEGAPSDSTPDVFLSDPDAGFAQISSPFFGGTTRGTSGGPELSDTGATVVFYSRDEFLVEGQPNNNTWDVFRWVDGEGLEVISRDRDGGPPNGSSTATDVSGDGTVVIFQSVASDLVQGDANGTTDVFVVVD